MRTPELIRKDCLEAMLSLSCIVTELLFDPVLLGRDKNAPLKKMVSTISCKQQTCPADKYCSEQK